MRVSSTLAPTIRMRLVEEASRKRPKCYICATVADRVEDCGMEARCSSMGLRSLSGGWPTEGVSAKFEVWALEL